MNYPVFLITVYYIIINFTAFILYYSDKRKAVNHNWRIPEATLIGVSFAGGGIGAYAAMKLFRHKTKHLKFTLLVPISIILHILAVIFVVVKF